VIEAVYRARSDIAGYRVDHALTYVTITQSLLMVAPQWGEVGVSARVRTGQIATDLCRPVNFTLLHFSGQMGAAAFQLATRCLPILLIGWLAGYLGALPGPELWAPAAVSVVLAAWIAAAVLFLVELTSFWLESDRGIRRIVLAVTTFFGGLLVPVAYFPAWLQAIGNVLPFQHTLNTPSHIFIGIVDAPDAWALVAAQAAWALGLTAVCHVALRFGTRRLVVAGG
jgi:ABC-2 type transport system permease protein